jgi:hypothetical protein
MLVLVPPLLTSTVDAISPIHALFPLFPPTKCKLSSPFIIISVEEVGKYVGESVAYDLTTGLPVGLPVGLFVLGLLVGFLVG